MSENVFKPGDYVRKVRGYLYPGVVVSAFGTLAGKRRYVVESTAEDTAGMLHIFNADQLELTPPSGNEPR